MRQLFTDTMHPDMSRQSNGPVLVSTSTQLADIAPAMLEGFDCTYHMTANLEVRSEGRRGTVPRAHDCLSPRAGGPRRG
jgi:hypothetical protein